MQQTGACAFFALFCVLLATAQPAQDSSYNPSTGTFDPGNAIVRPSGTRTEQEKMLPFSYDCETDFWTTTTGGVIEQWSLVNGVTGSYGVVLTGSGASLGFYDNGVVAPTFYCARGGDGGTLYYSEASSWEVIPDALHLYNNGGGYHVQYYMSTIGIYLKRLHYFDGTHFTTIDSLETERFLVADVAVDPLGRAWAVTGTSYPNAEWLNVYNPFGLIASYGISFNTDNAYGSFFLGNKLYFGIRDSLFPVGISGTHAFLEAGIAFPNNGYTDMTNCTGNTHASGLEEQQAAFTLYPNPVTDELTIGFSGTFVPTTYTLTDAAGRAVRTGMLDGSLTVFSVEGLSPGAYLLQIGNRTPVRVIVGAPSP